MNDESMTDRATSAAEVVRQGKYVSESQRSGIDINLNEPKLDNPHFGLSAVSMACPTDLSMLKE